MSFSVHNKRNNLIYNGNSLATLFAQKRNLLNPKFWALLKDILRFNRRCKELHAAGVIDADKTLGDFMAEEKFSDSFAENYILPMCAAIWSASLGEASGFPLRFFVQFFENHGLLNVNDRPQWFSIKGGSKQYIPALTRGWHNRIHLATPVSAVTRTENGVKLDFRHRDTEIFDEVIFACHSDQALSLLKDASDAEQQVLGDIPYRMNKVVLHTDASVLPPIPSAVASWNYYLDGGYDLPASVSYSMNILQCLPDNAPQFSVTLNPIQPIDKSKILGEFDYAHPVFSRAMVAAQGRRSDICGQQHTHFCGAYWYSGFHEDGVRSALDVCQRLAADKADAPNMEAAA